MGALGAKIKGATLIESLIAMIIIVVCLGAGTMIYSNVLNSDKQRLKFKAILLLNTEANKIKKDKRFLDDEQQIGDYLIRKTIKKLPETENLYSLILIAINKEGNIIGTHTELIFTE